MFIATIRWLVVLALSPVLLVSVALAEATVVVELRRADGTPTEGTVTLVKGDTKLQCTTQRGRCDIKNVPGGMYRVEVNQGEKKTSKAKNAMIPPSGDVKLIVAAE